MYLSFEESPEVNSEDSRDQTNSTQLLDYLD